MLEIVQEDFAGTCGQRFNIGRSIELGSLSTTFEAFCPVGGPFARAIQVRRSKADFLRQGPVIYGRDKAVENYQMHGRVTSYPRAVGGYGPLAWGSLPANWKDEGCLPIYSNRVAFVDANTRLSAVSGDYAVSGRSNAYMFGAISKTDGDLTYTIPIHVRVSIGPLQYRRIRPTDPPGYALSTNASAYEVSARFGKWSNSSRKGLCTYQSAQSYTRDLLRTMAGAAFPGYMTDRRELQAWLYDHVKWAFDLVSSEARSAAGPSSTKIRNGFPTVEELYGSTSSLGAIGDVDQYAELIRGLCQSTWFNTNELSLHGADLVDSYNEFSSNLIAYLSDLGKTGDTIRTLAKLPKDIKNPKAWASAWLSGRYGDRLFVSDTRDLLKSVARASARNGGAVPCRARTEKDIQLGSMNGTVRRTSTAVIANESANGLMTGINNLMKWDLWPTLENTWDLVPLSFVVDWVLPVQDLLDQIDKAVQSPYLKVLGSYASERIEAQGRIHAEGCEYELRPVYYRRFPHNALSDIEPFTVRADLPSFSAIHAGDALALIVQFRR